MQGNHSLQTKRGLRCMLSRKDIRTASPFALSGLNADAAKEEKNRNNAMLPVRLGSIVVFPCRLFFLQRWHSVGLCSLQNLGNQPSGAGRGAAPLADHGLPCKRQFTGGAGRCAWLKSPRLRCSPACVCGILWVSRNLLPEENCIMQKKRCLQPRVCLISSSRL